MPKLQTFIISIIYLSLTGCGLVLDDYGHQAPIEHYLDSDSKNNTSSHNSPAKSKILFNSHNTSARTKHNPKHKHSYLKLIKTKHHKYNNHQITTPDPTTQIIFNNKNIHQWHWPTDKYKSSNPNHLNYKNIDNILYFNGQSNQPVLATESGKVIFSGPGIKPFGNMIIISQNKSINTIYGNLININIQEGDTITKGMQIAQMGLNQAKSHGVLIFEARKNGIVINPDKYFLYLKHRP